jgi:ParB/RepB/Spo0J family partition protein
MIARFARRPGDTGSRIGRELLEKGVSDMTTQLVTPEVEVDKIEVVDGFNSRRHFDQAELKALAKTIEENGMIEPLAVKRLAEDRFALVAGERRYRAAKIAGLKKVPVVLRSGNARAEAFIENHHRADLNPIETALDLRAYGQEFGKSTAKDIAKLAGKRPEWVADHLRLLNLPQEVQRYISEGHVPMSAEPKLRKIAEGFPAVAVAVCEVAKQNEITGKAFLDRFPELFAAAAEVKVAGKPPMISARRFRVSEVAKGKKGKALVEKVNSVLPHYRQSEDPEVELGEAELDAARAAGCLVELPSERNGYRSVVGFITDKAFAADLIDREVDRIEKEHAEAQARAEAEKADKKAVQQKLREERKASGEETPQAKAKRLAKLARRFNEDLGNNLLRGRRAARRRSHGLQRAKAIAYLLIEQNEDLAAQGLRLTSPQLQEVEVKTLKSGKRKETVIYPDPAACRAELERRVEAARTEAEVMETLSEALIAAHLADEEELPRSKRVHWRHSLPAKAEKLLSAEIKEMRPRRSRKAA